MVAISAGCSPYRAARYVGSEQGGGHLVGFGRCFILFRGEQQRHVDRDPGIHAFLNGGQALGGSRDLDEQVAPGAPAAQGRGLLDGALRVVGQQRGYLQRHPAVHTVGAGMDGGELICSPAQVGQGKLEDHLLVGGAGGLAGGDVGVVVRALLDRIVKDGRAREAWKIEIDLDSEIIRSRRSCGFRTRITTIRTRSSSRSSRYSRWTAKARVMSWPVAPRASAGAAGPPGQADGDLTNWGIQPRLGELRLSRRRWS